MACSKGGLSNFVSGAEPGTGCLWLDPLTNECDIGIRSGSWILGIRLGYPGSGDLVVRNKMQMKQKAASGSKSRFKNGSMVPMC